MVGAELVSHRLNQQVAATPRPIITSHPRLLFYPYVRRQAVRSSIRVRETLLSEVTRENLSWSFRPYRSPFRAAMVEGKWTTAGDHISHGSRTLVELHLEGDGIWGHHRCGAQAR